MKLPITSCLAAAILLSACGKKAAAPASGAQSPGASAPSEAASSSSAMPVSEPAISAMGEGNTDAAVRDFVNADWSARPLFTTGSSLNLSEAQFEAIPQAEREKNHEDVSGVINALRQTATATVRAAHEAAAKGDKETARKYLEAVKNCGQALDKPDRLNVLIILGQSMQRDADRELSHLDR